MKGWTKLLASKGHWVLTLRPLSEKAKCCSSFLSAACSLPGNLPEEASTTLQQGPVTGFVWSPNLPVPTGLCVMATPSQAQPITTRPVSLLYSERKCMLKEIHIPFKKKFTTVILNKKTCYTERCIYSIQYSINVME